MCCTIILLPLLDAFSGLAGMLPVWYNTVPRGEKRKCGVRAAYDNANDVGGLGPDIGNGCAVSDWP